jgi:DNA-binding HxlR family transcriptional regulator
MPRSRKEISCPAEITLKVIGGRWKLMIMRELSAGVTRFGELRRGLKGISEKIPAQHLRELEKDGVVERKIYA